MGKDMALTLLLLLGSSFTVFSQVLDTLPPSYPHTPTPLHPPTKSPTYPPVNAPHPHHHRHHHHHTPAPAPAKPPTHPYYPPVPAKPPTHNRHHRPVHAKPPTHLHYPPTPVHPRPAVPVHPPVRPPVPVHPPVHPPVPVQAPVHPPVPVQAPVHPPVPVQAPVHPPVPVRPPAHPPVPVHPLTRSFVAVQGVVYVKSCKYAGVDTLLEAKPLLGAIVKLQCNNTKYKLFQTGKTDKNGYFFIEAPKSVTTYGAHKCNVVLVSAPDGLIASNLHGGVNGAVLRPEKPFMHEKLPFLLYTVGPLAFEPKCH